MADNVIKAVFANGRSVKTAPLWRYDHGIKLQPIGLELPENYEIHFSNSKTGEAKTMLADASGAVIPAEYLIPGTEVYAWIYLVGESYGRTKAEIIIPIDAKAKPTDQEPTPEQQPIIEQAIDALNDAQDALEEAASHIIESGITPEERAKLAGIEAGAEVNVIEEVRVYDLLNGYVPLPITDKGVNLPRYPEVENVNDVVYVDFEIDADGNVTLSPSPTPIVDAVNLHGQTVIARVKLANDSCYYFLPLTHIDGNDIRFTGFTGTAEKLEVRWDTNSHKWRAQLTELVDWDSAGNSYVWANQGSENSGKVLTVGADGNVTPQDAAGGTNDYSDLSNKPQINSVALSGNKSLGDLGIEAEAFVVIITESDGTYTADKTASQIFGAVAAKKRVVATLGVTVFQYCLQAGGKAYFTAIYSNTSLLLAVAESKAATVSIITLGTYTKPSGGIPASDLAAAVQTSLGKADTAIQQHQDISGKLDKNQGMAHAGEFLVVGSDGNMTTQAVEENNSLAAFATDIASGAIASFTDGADDIPVKDLTIAIEPVQAGSGDPSPSNVRPITGWTAANVTRTGKNLFDKTDPDVRHGYAVSTTSGTLYTASSGIWSASGFMPVKGGNQYIISGDNAANDLAFYDANKVFISGASDGSRAITAPANACYARMDYTIANEDRIQFEQSSAATAYEAYQGTSCAIPFPTEAGTVYSGTLDVTTGKLTVDRAMIASYNGEALPGEWISDRDVYAAGTAPTTGAQVVYALAEPMEYDLTPTEVTTLLGANNIWADCGDSTVEYRADTKLYADKKIAAIPSVPMWNGGSY